MAKNGDGTPSNFTLRRGKSREITVTLRGKIITATISKIGNKRIITNSMKTAFSCD